MNSRSSCNSFAARSSYHEDAVAYVAPRCVAKALSSLTLTYSLRVLVPIRQCDAKDELESKDSLFESSTYQALMLLPRCHSQCHQLTTHKPPLHIPPATPSPSSVLFQIHSRRPSPHQPFPTAHKRRPRPCPSLSQHTYPVSFPIPP